MKRVKGLMFFKVFVMLTALGFSVACYAAEPHAVIHVKQLCESSGISLGLWQYRYRFDERPSQIAASVTTNDPGMPLPEKLTVVRGDESLEIAVDEDGIALIPIASITDFERAAIHLPPGVTVKLTGNVCFGNLPHPVADTILSTDLDVVDRIQAMRRVASDDDTVIALYSEDYEGMYARAVVEWTLDIRNAIAARYGIEWRHPVGFITDTRPRMLVDPATGMLLLPLNNWLAEAWRANRIPGIRDRYFPNDRDLPWIIIYETMRMELSQRNDVYRNDPNMRFATDGLADWMAFDHLKRSHPDFAHQQLRLYGDRISVAHTAGIQGAVEVDTQFVPIIDYSTQKADCDYFYVERFRGRQAYIDMVGLIASFVFWDRILSRMDDEQRIALIQMLHKGDVGRDQLIRHLENVLEEDITTTVTIEEAVEHLTARIAELEE